MRPAPRILRAGLAPLALAACTSAAAPPPDDDAAIVPDASTDDGPDAGADADASAGCLEIMRSCPADHPHPGGPCEGALSCPYEDEIVGLPWTYDCVRGEWVATPTCGGGCPTPPLAELCIAPFTGTLEGATVEMGPASLAEPFRAFAPDEVVEAIVGPQGGVMLPFRLRVTGSEVPACVGATTTLTVSDIEHDPSTARVTLHCGESLAVFAVLPTDLCATGRISVRFDIAVAGIGSTSANVVYDAPGCVNSQ